MGRTWRDNVDFVFIIEFIPRLERFTLGMVRYEIE